MKALTPEQFAVALKCHRDRLKLSQPAAARLVGVSARKWWRMEHGEAATSLREQVGTLALLKEAKS